MDGKITFAFKWKGFVIKCASLSESKGFLPVIIWSAETDFGDDGHYMKHALPW